EQVRQSCLSSVRWQGTIHHHGVGYGRCGVVGTARSSSSLGVGSYHALGPRIGSAREPYHPRIIPSTIAAAPPARIPLWLRWAGHHPGQEIHARQASALSFVARRLVGAAPCPHRRATGLRLWLSHAPRGRRLLAQPLRTDTAHRQLSRAHLAAHLL